MALITGAARGIGLATASTLSGQGYRLALVDRDQSALEQTRDLVGAAWTVCCDVSDPEAVQEAVADAAKALGRLDLLVNNAGILRSASILDHSVEIFDQIMLVNVRAALFCLQAAARVMLAARAGCIVNVSSVSGIISSGTPAIAYDMSKAAVRQMTVSAARELGPHGIRVNAVAPYTTRTDLTKPLVSDAARLERDLAYVPLGRIAEPQEIAEAIAFLGSPSASYINGHTLVLDGGRLT